MKNENQFSTGDYCKLNSGGPVMRVLFVRGEIVDCKWDNESGIDRAEFPYQCLTKLDSKPGRVSEK